MNRYQGKRKTGSTAWGGMAPVLLLLLAGCYGVTPGAARRNDLKSMRTVDVRIADKATFIAYVADNEDTRELGLMNITEDDLPPGHGMLFVFTHDRPLSFWMRNTLIPLDIAYFRTDGTIVRTLTMQPFNEAGYPSVEPARMALELRAGELDKHGIRAGDRVEVPADWLE
jgi:uncharacterized membrane protein (UPF0127 family)